MHIVRCLADTTKSLMKKRVFSGRNNLHDTASPFAPVAGIKSAVQNSSVTSFSITTKHTNQTSESTIKTSPGTLSTTNMGITFLSKSNICK